MQIYHILIVEYNFLPSIQIKFSLIFNVLVGNILGSHSTPPPLCHQMEPKISPKNCFQQIFYCCRFSIYDIVDMEILSLLYMQKCRKTKKRTYGSESVIGQPTIMNEINMNNFLFIWGLFFLFQIIFLIFYLILFLFWLNWNLRIE